LTLSIVSFCGEETLDLIYIELSVWYKYCTKNPKNVSSRKR
jgi:hypothetical protein